MTQPQAVADYESQDPASWRDQITKFGYVIIHDAVPPESTAAVLDDIWSHTGASPDDPESWYRPDVISHGGMVEMYHYQSMWNVRQEPRLYEIFQAVLGSERLWVSMDRVGFKPPVSPRHPDYDHKGMIHWDADIEKYPDLPFHVQGVLALTDTEPDMGGFQCIPETYQDLEAFLKTQKPEALASRSPDVTGYTITHPRLRAGDLLVWTNLLLHGNGHNTSTIPRFCQYVSMSLAPEDDDLARASRVTAWNYNIPSPVRSVRTPFPGDPRRIEASRPAPAELTPLGRKLLGLDSW